jgi:hypothetical protein
MTFKELQKAIESQPDYGLSHFPWLALYPVPPGEHPLASASCVSSTISTATMVISPNAASMAKITIVVWVSISYLI